MISEKQFQTELDLIIQNGIREDIGPGDFSSLACIPDSAKGKAKLLVKDTGIIAGVAFARMIFENVDPTLEVETFIEDGAVVKHGDVVFHVSGNFESRATGTEFDATNVCHCHKNESICKTFRRNKNQNIGHAQNHTRISGL
jgi:nicotinate-nucleotide pyrophosphorylase